MIVEAIEACGGDALALPAALVAQHGPFAWGRDIESRRRERGRARGGRRARPTARSRSAPTPSELDPALRERHFTRKHGPGRYYGQP